MNDLLMRYTLADLVDLFLKQEEEIRQAYLMLSNSAKELERAFGKPRYYRPTFYTTDSFQEPTTIAESVLKHLRLSFWEAVIDRSGMYKILSAKRLYEIRAYFNQHNRGSWDDSRVDIHLPEEVTLQTVMEYVGATFEARTQIVQELFLETWDYLMPGAKDHWSTGHYKTNLKNARFKLGSKVILTNAVSRASGKGRWEVYHWNNREYDLASVDKVFHLLDGKGVPDGQVTPLIDGINMMTSDEAENNYFSWKCYHNGNLHLSFKRPDLVQAFNEVMGKDKFILGDGVQL